MPFIGEPNHHLYIDKFNENDNDELIILSKTLNDIISKTKIFQRKGNINFFNTNEEKVISAVRYGLDDSDEKTYIYVFINFDTESEKIITINEKFLKTEINFSLLSAYLDVVKNELVEVHGGQWEIKIPAGGFKLYSPF